MKLSRCPMCGRRLVKGGDKAYETLIDHVESPNDTPPLRPTQVCENGACPCAVGNGFFSCDPFGKWYNGKNGLTIPIRYTEDSGFALLGEEKSLRALTSWRKFSCWVERTFLKKGLRSQGILGE